MDVESIFAALPPGSSMYVDDLLAALPRGYKFHPPDSEIIAYLKCEIESRNHRLIWPVHRVVFRNYKPQQLAEKYRAAQDNKWYFVSHGPPNVNLDVNRNHKGWKITHEHSPMEKRVYKDGQVVGYTGKFEFLDENYHKTEWRMRFYAINDPTAINDPNRVNKLSEWILYKMYKKDEEEEEEEELEEYASSNEDGEKYDQEI